MILNTVYGYAISGEIYIPQLFGFHDKNIPLNLFQNFILNLEKNNITFL